jgi:glycerol-3-phosphate acyltransferase PlsY
MMHPETWAEAWLYLVGAFAFGYVLGSIPFGLLLTRLAGLGDIRKIGSGNIGATNVLRTGNKGLAAATLILDGGKGAAAVLLADIYGPDLALFAGAGAIAGHLFPVWLGFRGGKGVASALGVLLALSWPVGVAACLTWAAAAALFRYSSLAALLALAAAPGFAYLFADPSRTAFAAALAVVIWLTHAKNIRRLVAGEEPKIGRKSAVGAAEASPPH